MPEAGGCERTRTEPFISFINGIRNAEYHFKGCLDQLHRNSPQPESMYRDLRTGNTLVIERKTIVWPEDYVESHKIDHLISEVLWDGLNRVLSDGWYRLDLAPLFKGKREDVETFAKDIIANVLINVESLRMGKTITEFWQGSPESARKQRWQIRRLAAWEHEPGDQVGVQIFWDARPRRELIPWSLPTKLSKSIEKKLLSCERKFRSYEEAQSILVIEPHGDLRYQSQKWWAEVWKFISPPKNIDEIWMGIQDHLDEYEEGWIFEILFHNCASALGEKP